MVVVQDQERAEWLAEWLEARSFQWDAGNSSKIEKKHGLSRADVESVFDGVFALWGRIVDPPHAESRWIVLGHTPTGRHVSFVFTVRGALLRPISCRSMRRNERSRYDAEVLR